MPRRTLFETRVAARSAGVTRLPSASLLVRSLRP